MKRIAVVMLLVLMLGLGTGTVGCSLLDRGESLEAIKAQAAMLEQDAAVARQVATQLKAQAEALDVVIAAMPEGPERDKAVALRDHVVTALAKVQVFLDKAAPALVEINAVVQEANDALGAIEAAAATGTAFLPPPWNMIALGVPLVFALIRAWRNKQNGLAAIKSVNGVVQKALKADPSLAGTLSVAQGAGAKALVDQAQGSRGLPI